MQGAQKFSKIELIMKDITSTDADFPSNTKIEFKNVGMVITGNHMIIADTETIPNPDYHPENGNPMIRPELPVSTVGKLFNLNEIISYKTIH